MPKVSGQRYKVISGEHETFVTEISFHAAAVLAIKMFDLKNTKRAKKLGPFVMVIATTDGDYQVVDTQYVLDEIGLKYDRIIHPKEEENAENSDSKCDEPDGRNLKILPFLPRKPKE